MTGASIVLSLLLLSSTAGFAADVSKASDAGINVHLSLKPFGDAKMIREGAEAEVTVRLSDETNAPISALGINGWFSPHAPGAPPLERRACVERIAQFTAGGLFRQPALDLNVFRVAVLNADPTISIVDPRLGFGGSNLLAMVELESAGEDWVGSPDRRSLFVAMPEAGKVAVVDATTWKVRTNIAIGPRVTRVVLQPDGGYVWATYADGVAAIDPNKLTVVKRIKTGAGIHDLAISDDNRTLFVTNGESGTTSVVDVRRLAVARQVASGANPISIAWSSAARAAYAVSSSDGVVVGIDAQHAEPRAKIAAVAGITRIRFAPGARYGFITNPPKDRVYILDAASDRIVQTAAVEKGPFEVAFSDTIAYIRHLFSETVLMITLANVGKADAPVSVADFPGGQRGFGASGVAPIAADGIVQVAGENAVLVTNPADKGIYYYREGMAAPMADLPAYSHVPRATMIIDRSLREVKPGVFSTIATMPAAGVYDVALYVDSPRAITCFQVSVER